MNEREIIELFQSCNQQTVAGLQQGIGDDCAVIEKDSSHSFLVTMDTLIEKIHFDLGWHSPEKLGRKSVAVNVSDIAAMGGEPKFAFLSLGLPGGFDSEWANAFSRGLSEACSEYGCFLVGGDTVRSREGVLITITLLGEARTDRIVYRHGALPEDAIWVSGTLGRAAAGLELCRSGVTGHGAHLQSLIEAHLDPVARLKLGRLLAESKLAHSMMDLSDGLATDLSHLCKQSGVGAEVFAETLPHASLLHEAAKAVKKDPLSLMIQGGEDYELVFTAGEESSSAIQALAEKVDVPLTRIGSITVQQSIRLLMPAQGQEGREVVDIRFSGFDHFPEK